MSLHPAAPVQRPRHRRAPFLLALAATACAAVLASGVLAGTAAAQPATGYHFTTLDNSADTTFNQLLGINNESLISGYFGAGTVGHPNKGYLLSTAGGHPAFTNENYPGAVQTQVTGLNDLGITVGFWSDADNANGTNANYAFYTDANHHFHTVSFPTSDNSTPPVNQLLGINDREQAVGFYTDSAGNSHGYVYAINENHFSLVKLPASGVSSLTAAAINNSDDVGGFATVHGHTEGFLLTWNDHLSWLAVPGASMTQAFGVNDADEVVGAYQVGTGNNAVSHGFTWTPSGGFETVDDPSGPGATTINGVNDAGDLVGFYTDSKGNTDGFLATSGS